MICRNPALTAPRLSRRSDDPLYWCAATAAIGRILLENGYRTSRFGKDHNTPTWTASQAGLFDQWPSGMGFEYF
jgi:arylsulfatase A-like enzyme